MKFGENLKNLRKMHKLSQEDLAEKLNISRQSISKWETGEAYPEMNNLLELCKIFHCKINDLVNDNLLDVDSLDEKVKKEIVSLKKEEQQKMKTLSKVISVIASIGRVFFLIAIPFIVASMLLFPYLLNKLEIKDNELTITGSDILSIKEEDEKIILKVNNITIADVNKEIVDTNIISILNNNSKAMIITYMEIALLTLGITVYLISLIFKHLKELFANLSGGETPFTLENVYHIKKMAYFMIATIILPNIGGLIFNNMISSNISMDFEMFDIVEILFLFSLSYIFEYGRLIETNNKKESK